LTGLIRLLKNAICFHTFGVTLHPLCGVLAVRLIPQDSRALRFIIFEQPARNAVSNRLSCGTIGKRDPWRPAFFRHGYAA